MEALEEAVQQRAETLHNQEHQLEKDVLRLRAAEADERRQLTADAARLAQQESAISHRETALADAQAGLRVDEVNVQ